MLLLLLLRGQCCCSGIRVLGGGHCPLLPQRTALQRRKQRQVLGTQGLRHGSWAAKRHERQGSALALLPPLCPGWSDVCFGCVSAQGGTPRGIRAKMQGALGKQCPCGGGVKEAPAAAAAGPAGRSRCPIRLMERVQPSRRPPRQAEARGGECGTRPSLSARSQGLILVGNVPRDGSSGSGAVPRSRGLCPLGD